jgi:hypothetical protein
MKSFFKIVLLVTFLFGPTVQGQESKCLEVINSNIWNNFTKAFENLDYELFESLHSNDFIRVSGNTKSLKNKSEYIEDYKNNWNSRQPKQTISFRFLERICNSSRASERGIYRLTLNPETKEEKSYYGKFHVILVNQNSKWKILVDYDSSEANSINKNSYDSASAIDYFEKN